MKLALGTAQFGLNYGIANTQGQVSNEEAKQILDFARVHGMDTLDTAIAYGQSEQRLGEIGIEKWQVVSKLPAVPEKGPDIYQWVRTAVNDSLRRLKVKSLYGLLLHRPQQLLEDNGDTFYKCLQELRHNGLVQKIGVSVYAPAELDALFSRFQFDLIQAPFNVFDRRLIDTGWMQRLGDLGTELHVRSVFLQGLLLLKRSERPHKFSRWATLWSSWEAWLRESGQTPLQTCIGFALSFPEISKVIVGVDSLRHLREVLEAAEKPALPMPRALTGSDEDLINPTRWPLLR